MKNKHTKYSDHPVRAWFIHQSIDHAKRTIIISILLTLFMASGLGFFTIDDDIMKMMPKNLESRVSWDNIQEEFGSTEVIFIAFGHQEKTVYSPEALATLWDLSEELEASKSVEEVTCISTSTRMDNIDGFMEIDDLQPEKDLSIESIESIKKYLEKNNHIKQRFVSKNEDYLIAIIQPYEDISKDSFVDEVTSVANPILEGYEIYYGGQSYITGIMPSSIRNDVKGLMLVGMLILSFILLINIRSIPGVALVLMVILLSLIAMLGFMGWIHKLTGSGKFLFTLANTSMPIILLTIANSDGVHIVIKFFKELRHKQHIHQAVASTMDSLLIPVFLTSLTTVVAFLTMISSPLEPLIGYGLTISSGIIWAWFLSSTLLPAVISIKKWNLKSKAITHPSIFEKAIHKLANKVLTHPKYVFATGLIIVLIGAGGLFKVSVDVNMANFFKPGTEIRKSMEFMDNEMTGTVDIRVLLEGEMKNPKTMTLMAELQDFMESDPKVSTSYSIADVVKQMHRTVMDDNPEFETIPNSKEKINNLYTMYSMSGDLDDFSSMVDYDYKVGLITAFSQSMTTNEIFKFVNKCKIFIDEHIDSALSYNFTGMIVIFRDLVILIIKSTFFSILFSLVMIGILSSIFFKKILWGVLAIMPLTASVILDFGFMGYFGIELSHVTAILSSIIIGVGVDFAIHYIAQFRRLSRTVDEGKLSREVMDDVGYPIILDAFSNMGFGALLFSAFLPIQYIGGLMIFAMVSTAFGTLTVLSAMVELLRRKLIEK